MEETTIILKEMHNNLQKLAAVVEKKKPLEQTDEITDLIDNIQRDTKNIGRMVEKGKLLIDTKLQNELLNAIETIKKSSLFQQDLGKMQVVFQQILLLLTKNIKDIPYKVVKVNLPTK